MKNSKSTIPLKLRQELSNDPTYKYCCVTGKVGTPSDPIEWHHNLKYAGSNLQRRFCILPILRSIHLKADTREVREKLNWVMWNRATDAEIAEFSKATNYARVKEALNDKFGVYIPPLMTSPGPVKTVSSEPKPLWFLVSEEQKTRLQKAINFHKEQEGITYSPFSLIELAIKEHCDEVDRLMEEEGIVSPVGFIG